MERSIHGDYRAKTPEFESCHPDCQMKAANPRFFQGNQGFAAFSLPCFKTKISAKKQLHLKLFVQILSKLVLIEEGVPQLLRSLPLGFLLFLHHRMPVHGLHDMIRLPSPHL